MLLEQINKDLDVSLDQAVKSMVHQLSRVRTGRANASLLDNIKVDYYGAPTPLNQLVRSLLLRQDFFKFNHLISK